MVRRACIALVASLAFVPATAGAAAAYEPDAGPVFNQPRPSGSPGQWRIANQVEAAVKGVPRLPAPGPDLDGDSQPDYDFNRDGVPDTPAEVDANRPEIKIATYSHDLKGVTDALIAAHRRGASVQMVINDNWTSYQTKRLIEVLGRDREQRSFLHVCAGACRGSGQRTNQHAKYYLFSQTGTAKNVVMTGSANTTEFAARVHWNDLFTAKNAPDLFQVYRSVFLQMKNDDGDPNGYKTYNADGYDGYFFPKYGFSQADDPVLKRLNAVSCDAGSGGIRGATAIRINMYAWTGNRGLWIAEKMAQLKRQGCNVRAIVSNQGAYVLKALNAAGIAVRSASLDLNNNNHDGWGGSGFEVFTHQKWMVLNGKFEGTVGKHVWTGSDNWSDLSNNNDEVTIHIRGARTYGRYMNNFDLMWTRWSRAL